MRIYLRLCYFCHSDGEIVTAVGSYDTPQFERYDLCEKHLKICEEEERPIYRFKEGEEIETAGE